MECCLAIKKHEAEMKAGSQSGTCTPVFTAASFTTAKRQQQPRCPPIDGPISKMWSVYREIFFVLKKEGDSDTGYHMDETWGHYAQWKKETETKCHKPYGSIYMKCPESANQRDIKEIRGCPGLGAGEGVGY